MAKFTIKDLAEGKCAVKNDGTVEELNKVLRAAFPKDVQSSGDWIYYAKHYYSNRWESFTRIEIPVQSVKEFLEELESLKLPKRGDRILVYDTCTNCWLERIFITYIEGAKHPVVCVADIYEREFNSGEPFFIT